MIAIMEPMLLETAQLYEKWLEEKAERPTSNVTAVDGVTQQEDCSATQKL
jgi:hypothetical protein